MSDLEHTPSSGAAGLPSQEFPGGGDQASIDARAVAAALKEDPEFANLLKNLAGAGAQSAKDKRMDRIENKQVVFEERLARYEEYIEQGMTPAQAKRQMKVDDALEYVETMSTSAPIAPQPAKVGSQGSGAEADAQELLTQAGISKDDPEFLELMRSTPPTKLLKETTSLIVRRVIRKPMPTGATAITPSGGTGGSPDLMAQYKAALGRIPEGNKEAVLRLRMEYRKKGLSI